MLFEGKKRLLKSRLVMTGREAGDLVGRSITGNMVLIGMTSQLVTTTLLLDVG